MSERISKQAQERKDKYKIGIYINLPEGVEPLKLRGGTMRLDIIPYKVVDKKHPEEIPVGESWWRRLIYTHRDIGPEGRTYLCPLLNKGLPCPICEEYQRLRRDPEADDDIVKALKPKERELVNVIDVSSDDSTIKVLEVSTFLFGDKIEEEIRARETEGDDDVSFDLEGGKTLKVRWSEETFRKGSYFKATRIDFKDRDDYDESILKGVVCFDKCLMIPTYEELETAFIGGSIATKSEDDDMDDDDDDMPEPPERKKRVEEDDDDDEDIDDDDEDDIEDLDDDEDDDDDEDEEDIEDDDDDEDEDDDDDDDEEVEPKTKKKRGKLPTKKNATKKKKR